MFCRNCGNQLDDKAVACTKCGVNPHNGSAYCSNCGKPTDTKAVVCINCGVGFKSNKECNKILVGILAIILGGFGVHKFIMGYTKEGVIELLLGVFCGIGFIFGIIEGIIYLTKSDEDFVATYITGKKGWF